MTVREVMHSVWLADRQVGTIHQRGDHTKFMFLNEYKNDSDRPVFGLRFEAESLLKVHSSALRLPPWFSNLLPEGRMRQWVADHRGVSAEREMELLAELGHDLPGAVRVLKADGYEAPSSAASSAREKARAPEYGTPDWPIRFSLAGVQLKFSVLTDDDRVTLPASGEGGDWIAKLPDRQFGNVPRNEFAMMSLAAAAGINVPEIRLFHRDQFENLPARFWPTDEKWAYAIRRFDRGPQRELIHMEDLAQVKNICPHQKYEGNFESVASLIYRGQDTEALREFARRLTFIVLIANGDAHVKNWSLIYREPRNPTLSPAYDLVAASGYTFDGQPEDLGLKLAGSRAFDSVRLSSFERIQNRLGAHDAGLAEEAERTVQVVLDEWPHIAEVHLAGLAELHIPLGSGLKQRAASLLRRH